MLKKHFLQLPQAAEGSTNTAEIFIFFQTHQTQLLYCKSYKLYYDSSWKPACATELLALTKRER